MFVFGAAGLALFFLFRAIANRNAAQQSQTQDTSVGPQQLAVDPTSWIDTQNQQTQQMQQMIGGMQDSLIQYQQSSQDTETQNMQALSDLMQQNQQATQQLIQSLHGSMATSPVYSPVTTTKAPTSNNKVTSSGKISTATKTMGNLHYAVPKGGFNTNSIVDYIKSKGGYSDMASRAKLAAQYGIKNYTGTAAQNSQFLSKLKTVYGN